MKNERCFLLKWDVYYSSHIVTPAEGLINDSPWNELYLPFYRASGVMHLGFRCQKPDRL